MNILLSIVIIINYSGYMLSIVIPCYNEAKTIRDNITNRVIPFLKYKNIKYEIILVNDGSKDNTLEEIMAIPGVNVVSYTPNHGKGYAIKQGLIEAKGDFILFMDADLSTDLKAIEDVMQFRNDYDVIIGSRHHKGSVLVQKQPLLRRFIGFGCRFLVNMKFKFHLTDTQCGFKAMNKATAKLIIEKQTIDDFAFDVEYLYIAKLNNKTIKEIPVVWENDRSSTVSPLASSIKFFKDLKIIKKNKEKYYVKS